MIAFGAEIEAFRVEIAKELLTDFDPIPTALTEFQGITLLPVMIGDLRALAVISSGRPLPRTALQRLAQSVASRTSLCQLADDLVRQGEINCFIEPRHLFRPVICV